MLHENYQTKGNMSLSYQRRMVMLANPALDTGNAQSPGEQLPKFRSADEPLGVD